jgi:hypothetical protein
VGPWDIMSEHFVKRNQPPPGLCSFTKIRLGWITADQALLVRPGDTACTFLSPLANKGNTLVVKIPLGSGRYFLVENRQPIGSDRALPDSGLLVLKVDPEVREGSGTVRIMDADPQAHHFSRATYKLDESRRNLFEDKQNKVSIIPLWSEGESMGVLVTSPDRSREALDAALKIQKLLSRFPEPRPQGRERLVRNCLAAFKRFDFKASAQLAQRGLQ